MIIFNQVVEHNLDSVYGAIADPTRRAILAMLANGDVNVGKVVDQFSISFNGVSKHVKVLERAGLIERTVVGREHRLRLNPKPLRDAAQWLDHYREFWEMRLDALEAFLTANVLNGFDPEQNRRLGFYYAVRDAELGEQVLTIGSEFPYAEDPSLWSVLELVQ